MRRLIDFELLVVALPIMDILRSAPLVYDFSVMLIEPKDRTASCPLYACA
jgi:hypothetical protein